jgi:predicted dehydrogenase
MKTIRWGIIGCGNVTEVKSGPGFQLARNSALAAVMRRDGAKAADYARRHGVASWYDDADHLIADREVDAVYVATPPAFHCDYTLRAARAGKPVYVEKPMARDHDECRRMIGACASAGVKLFVAYYRRALPRFLKVKELLDSGAIGAARLVSVVHYQPPESGEYNPATLPWRVIPELAGAGRFLDVGSHTLDLLDFLLGPIDRVEGHAANQAGLYRAEDIVAGSWRHESGALGNGVWCFSAGASHEMNEIVGAEGRIRFSTFGSESVRVERAGKVEELAIAHPPHIQQPMIQSIVDDLNGQGRCESTGESGARTSWVMDRMLEGWRAA